MSVVLLDTHAWVWSLFASSDLSASARRAIEAARTVLVAPCSFHEVTQKHRLGKWPEVDGIVGRLPRLLRAQGGAVAPYTATMAMLAGGMDWPHRDPFDRMIAATAIEMAFPLVSKDAAFDDLEGVVGWRGRLWDS
jgi:PIN domain nuclease of toxin-antitoxin system